MKFILKKHLIVVTLLLLTVGLCGCSTWSIWQQKPTVMVTSFQVIPSTDLAPKFKIGLHIVNPNRNSLQLEGLYYTISVEGHEIVEGVSNKLPTIGAFDVGDIELEAKANLINSLYLIRDLVHNSTDSCHYQLKAKLSVGMFLPSIHVTKEGTVSLRSLTR